MENAPNPRLKELYEGKQREGYDYKKQNENFYMIGQHESDW